MFHGAGGERLAEFQMSAVQTFPGYYLRLTERKTLVWFGSKLLRDGKYNVVQDRLGSVRWRHDITSGQTETVDYYPYGQEKPGATVNDREKFATYLRDSETGLDYADQRYHQPGWGRFLTPDPSGTNESPVVPDSWNLYAYAEGDPINSYDPDGLTCQDIVLDVFGVSRGITVGQFLNGRTDQSALAITTFTETRIGTDDLATKEKALVFGVIMNRWQFVNGYFTLYSNAKERSRGGVRTSDWGEANGSITSIVFAKSQFAVWDEAWRLDDDAHSRLNSAKTSLETSQECLSLLQSIQGAGSFWATRNEHYLFMEGGLVLTSFASPGRGGSEPEKSNYEQWIGTFGSGNRFAGVPLANIGPPIPPRPPSPGRPSLPRPRPIGPRI